MRRRMFHCDGLDLGDLGDGRRQEPSQYSRYRLGTADGRHRPCLQWLSSVSANWRIVRACRCIVVMMVDDMRTNVVCGDMTEGS